MAIISPTIKQKRALKGVLDNIGRKKPKTKGQILAEAGYSPAIVKNPQLIMEGSGFKALLQEHLGDDYMFKKHKKLFNQKQLAYFVFPKTMDDEEIKSHVEANGLDLIVVRPSDKGKMAFYSIDDAQAISKALDMGYKLKGSYAPEKSISIDLTPKANTSNADIASIAKRVTEELREKKLGEKPLIEDSTKSS